MKGVFGTETAVLSSGERYSATIIRQLFLGLLPIQILINLTSCVSSMIDGLVIGNILTPADMSALGFFSPLTIAIGALTQIFTGGARIVCGNYLGKGETDNVRRVFSSTMLCIAAFGGLLSALGVIFAVPVARLLGASGELTGLTAQYIVGTSLGFIPTIAAPCLMIFLQMEDRSGMTFAGTVLLVVCKLGFDLLFTSVLGMGLLGIGLATTLSQLVVMLLLMLPFILRKTNIHFRIKDVSMRISGRVLLLGCPCALCSILYTFRNISLNRLALSAGGAEAVAALAVLFSAVPPFDAIFSGINTTTLMLSSVIIGEKDSRSLKNLYRFSLRAGLVSGVLKFALLAVFSRQIIGFFSDGGLVYCYALRLLFFYASCYFVNYIPLLTGSFFQTVGRVRTVSIINLFNCLLLPVGASWLCMKLFGLDGVWCGFTISDILTLIFYVILCAVRGRRFPKRIDDLLCLDRDFDADAADKLSITVRDTKDVTNVSAAIVSFCRQRGIDSRRSHHIGLCMEEMAAVTMKHAMGRGSGRRRRNYVIDIFVRVSGDELLLRMRDNMPPMDTKTQDDITDPDDPCANIGIKLVRGIAKEFDRQFTFGMNVLTIKL